MVSGSLASAPTASILLVDDQPQNLLALQAVLQPLGHRLVQALSGAEALGRVREEAFAVVLLDVMMPGTDGLSTAGLLRREARGGDLPIILVTAGDTPDAEGYARGAVDVLRKPLDAGVVRAKVSVFVELFLAREQLRQHAEHIAREERAGQARIAALLNASLDGIIGMDAAGRVTEFNRAAEAMFGRGRRDVLGRSVAEVLVPPHLREAHDRGLARYLASGETRVLDRRIEVTALRADGALFPIELAIRRVAVEGPPTFLAYVRDATERTRFERSRAFLAQASQALGASLEYEATLQTVVRLAIAEVADWCAVDIAADDSGEPLRIAVTHVDPAKVALAEVLRRRYPPDPSASTGVPSVLRTGRAELHPDIPEAALASIARDAEHLQLLKALGLRSAIIVPIQGPVRTLGAITLVSAESGRRYDEWDLATAEDLGRRAGVAIENARLYRAAQLAEARNRYLAEATEALSSSLDYGETLERIARLAVPTIADSAALYRLEPDGSIRLTALAEHDPTREAIGRELDTLLPLSLEQQERMLPRVLRTGAAELLSELPSAVRGAWSPTTRAEELVRQLAIRSYMVVPIAARGQVFAALALTTSGSGRRLDADDLTLARELARRAGLAVENAQMYREAQESSRLKDDFLATISHELRTPLTAILGWLHLAKTGRPSQVSRALEIIERNANAQARIVDDVLDVSRVITGKLHLQLARVDLSDVLTTAIETLRPAADAKEIEIVVSLDPAAAEMTGDAARLQQVAWNLLSNAIKFTGRGGRIDVRLFREGSEACVRVSDNGEGIRKAFLPHVFERFTQSDNSATREHGGLGLGLSIVRHLVELHGGRVSADSEGEGLGATFTVLLPSAPRGASQPPGPA